jgi:hypothetical protein
LTADQQLQAIILLSCHCNCPNKIIPFAEKITWWNKGSSGLRVKTGRLLNVGKRKRYWNTYKEIRQNIKRQDQPTMNTVWKGNFERAIQSPLSTLSDD